MSPQPLVAAADGSAIGNPGPAGWAWFVDDEHWACGGWDHGTNNMGELWAVLDLLRQTAHLDVELKVLCDSQYVINSITRWMPGWKAKGWRKKDGKPVLNVEIIRAIDEAMTGRRVSFEWVKGHAGHALNEEADRLANGAARAHQAGRTPEPGPGFAGAPMAVAAPTAPPGSPVAGSGASDVQPALWDEDVEPDDVERVVALERELLRDEIRADATELARLLHPRWAEIGASGRLLDRDEVVAGLPPTGAELQVVRAERIGDDTILLLWRAVGARGASLRSSLWIRESGRWRQLFHQGTVEDQGAVDA